MRCAVNEWGEGNRETSPKPESRCWTSKHLLLPRPLRERAGVRGVSLASKLHAPEAARTFVAGIRCAETLTKPSPNATPLPPANPSSPALASGSAPTGYAAAANPTPTAASCNASKKSKSLREQLATLETTLADLQARSDHPTRSASALTNSSASKRKPKPTACTVAESEHRSRLHALQQRIDQLHSRRQQVEAEREELDAQRMQQEEDHLLATEQRNAALELLETVQLEHDQLAASPRTLAIRGQRCPPRPTRTARRPRKTSACHMETNRTQRDNSQRQLERITSRLELLEQQRDTLLEQMHMQDDPAADLQAELETALEQRRRCRTTPDPSPPDLCKHRKPTSASTMVNASKPNALPNKPAPTRKTASSNGKPCRCANKPLPNSSAKPNSTPPPCKLNYQPTPNRMTFLQQLENIQRSIQRLGAINLAAIDEFREQNERKQYLDQQNADLVSALETLDSAIRKIDRETRARFKETFDRVNSRLREMFPRLFGGGECYLEMTGDDLLTTGVAIMARPPGKRISTIYLMSGGEKALTAVALVFAIFELNPAPFCMLDEVDAPLDEANVGRFCELVRHMSEQVQFIFITHNKTTMELAENLIGVTMREAGVSRLVAVDMAEAVKLANG